MSTPPMDAASPSPGFPPLVSNPEENAGPNILGATIGTTVLAFLFFSARFYVRSFMVKALGWDDYFMALAMALSITNSTLVGISVMYGAGQHRGDVDQDVYMSGMKFNFLTQGMLQWGVCIVKLSIGCALLRIAVKKRWRYTIMGIMAFMVVYTAFCFATLFTQCKQVAMQWDDSIPRDCWPQSTLQALAFIHAGLNILTDFIFAIVIPVPMLWGLQMNKRTKAAVIGVLSLGVFVCLAGILRIPTIVNYGKTGDFLWDSRGLSVWFIAEFNTGIIAGSIPALKPVFKRVLDSTYLRSRAQKYGYGGQSGPASHQRSSKGFQNIRVTTRSKSNDNDEFDEFDGSNSQRDLVIDRNVPLGAIKKNVVTTVTQLPTHDSRNPRAGERRYGWEA